MTEPEGTIERRFEASLDAFVVFFGVWTVFCNLLVFAGASFRLLLLLSPLPVAGSIALFLLLRRSRPAAPLPLAPRKARIPLPYKLVCAALLVAGYAWSSHFVIFWMTAAALLVVCWLDRPRRAGEVESGRRGVARVEAALLVAVILGAALFTTFVHRPDADDAMYMSVPVALLDHPERPVLHEDTMHGEEGFPLLGPFYRVTSHEVLVGALAFVTRLDPRVLYYFCFPLLFAALLVVAHWLPLRLASPRTATFGLLLTCFVIWAWGDVHHAYGNFGFVRLFQGKAVLVSICAPAIFYYAMRFVSRGDLASWLRLALAQVAMMGLSVSGVFVAPLLAGLVLLGGWRPDRRSTRIFLTGLLASTAVLVAGIVVARQVQAFGEFVSPLESGSTLKSLGLVLGHGWRSWLALFGLLAAAASSCATPRLRSSAGYLTAAFILLLNPWAGDLIARLEPTVSWRALWAIPFPLILGLMGAQLAARGPSRYGIRLGAIGVVVFGLVFALVPGRWTSSVTNKAQFRLAAFKLGEGGPAAERAVELTPPGGVILAPRRVAMWVTGIRHHPRLLAVRQDYLEIIVGKVLGPDEALQRRVLMEFVHGKRGISAAVSVADEIARREIDTVVTHPDLTARGGTVFFEELASRGYVREEVAHGFLVWTRGDPQDILDP